MGGLFSKDKDEPKHTKRNGAKNGQEQQKSTGGQAVTTSNSNGTSATANNKAAPSPSVINSYDRCMLQLKLQRDKLNAASRRYDQRAEVEKQLAKQFLAEGKKEKALYCLKRKKAQEVHLDRVQKYLDNIYTMINNVENRQMDNEVATALKQGADELKALNDHLSLDDIEKIMEDATEQVNITNEASALLSQNLVTEDEEEFEKELEALCAADAKKASVPKTKTTEQKSTTDQTAAAAKQVDEVKVPTGDIVVPTAIDATEEAEEESASEVEDERVALGA